MYANIIIYNYICMYEYINLCVLCIYIYSMYMIYIYIYIYTHVYMIIYKETYKQITRT